MKMFAFILLFSASAFAEVTQGPATYVTTVTSLGTTAAQVAPSGPTACSSVKVCYLKSSNNIAYLVEAASLTAPQKAVVKDFGFPLYPVATSGDTCLTINATNINAKSRYVPVNSRNIWAASGGTGSKVSLVCQPY